MAKKFKVLGVEHTLYTEDKQMANYLEEIGSEYEVEDLRGVYNDNDREIYVRGNLNDKSFVHTFLHEWLHAVGTITGQPDLIGNTRKSEQFVDQLQMAIMDLFQQEELMKLLLEKLK